MGSTHENSEDDQISQISNRIKTTTMIHTILYYYIIYIIYNMYKYIIYSHMKHKLHKSKPELFIID